MRQGATTDVQLMSHQGSSLFGAGFWVGASAFVRRTALEDIAVTVEERGYPLLLYVRDRTLNEDTDTTVDLIRKGWTVFNYPARLAYSETPPDFGSLLIQRRRWATGGLIILPNLLRYFLARPSLPKLVETLLRAQYILSAPLGSLALHVPAGHHAQRPPRLEPRPRPGAECLTASRQPRRLPILPHNSGCCS